MKKMSKILAVLLTLTMLFGTVGYAASFSDVTSENNFYESIQILSGLGKMYSCGGEFTENIDNAGGKGTAEFCHQAIEIYCAK